jgi:hypothetical protein
VVRVFDFIEGFGINFAQDLTEVQPQPLTNLSKAERFIGIKSVWQIFAEAILVDLARLLELT